MEDYVDALAIDIKRAESYEIKSIYIGGGTPTYLSFKGWEKIKNAIKKLNFSFNTEFTIECNPSSIEDDKLKLFKVMGVNRLSIGLQAWQDKLLEGLGRIHRINDFREGYAKARKAGFNNINIDLIFGIPNQTLEDWMETLENVVNIKPEHISCYSLIIEEGTQFYKMYNENSLILPSEDTERKMYEIAVWFLRKKGYYQYEISNFSRPKNKCRHNIVYWSMQNYIGCGSSACSYINKTRYKNENNIEKYIELINSDKNAYIEIHKNSLKENIEEYMFLGLRKTNGINLKDFQKIFKLSANLLYKEVINKYLKLDLIRIDNGRLFLTLKGIQVSNTIMSDFLL